MKLGIFGDSSQSQVTKICSNHRVTYSRMAFITFTGSRNSTWPRPQPPRGHPPQQPCQSRPRTIPPSRFQTSPDRECTTVTADINFSVVWGLLTSSHLSGDNVADWAGELRPSMRKLRQGMDSLCKTARCVETLKICTECDVLLQGLFDVRTSTDP